MCGARTGRSMTSSEASAERAALNGVLPIDKPTGMTSHDVVDVVRRLYRTRRVGHTGTLDPAASGLLIVVMGPATKVAPYLAAQDKVYRAVVCFGATSDTGDGDGRITPSDGAALTDREQVAALAGRFVGEVTLPLPSYSAARTQGRRRYELARRGEELPPADRRTTIHSVTLAGYEPPLAQFLVHCSTGTYIRSLATEIGAAAGCGAYLYSLRRERIGRFDVSAAWPLARLEEMASSGSLPAPRPVEEFLLLPAIDVAPGGVAAVGHGRGPATGEVDGTEGVFAPGDTIVLRGPGQRIIAIAEASFASVDWPDKVQMDLQSLVRLRRVLI